MHMGRLDGKKARAEAEDRHVMAWLAEILITLIVALRWALECNGLVATVDINFRIAVTRSEFKGA